MALLARLVAGLPWTSLFLLGAILAPTDPVLASAIVGREEIPSRVRRLLNVESWVRRDDRCLSGPPGIWPHRVTGAMRGI